MSVYDICVSVVDISKAARLGEKLKDLFPPLLLLLHVSINAGRASAGYPRAKRTRDGDGSDQASGMASGSIPTWSIVE